MMRAYRSELIKLWRMRPAVITLIVTAVVAAGSAILVVVSAVDEPTRTGDALTIGQLADAGGGTQVFRSAVSFAGFFVFVVLTGIMAAEFSRGNIRTMLLHQPDRIRLLAGKFAALITSAAAVLALGAVLAWITARLVAPSQDIETSQWTSVNALGEGVVDYGATLFWVAGYGALGTLLAVVVRSVPVALAIGIGWFGPFEHIVADSWDRANDFFPGLSLEIFVTSGRDGVGTGQAMLTASLYAAVAAAVAVTLFRRRDVT